jgi:hippurate hydrolase
MRNSAGGRVKKIVAMVLMVLPPQVVVAADAEIPVPTLRADIVAMYPDIEKLYIDLHQNPELSLVEEKTAAKLAERMRKLGYDVTTKVGGTGVVAMLKNGAGPMLLVRTDMDALPVLEQTGLPYASKVTQKDPVTGETMPVMHACGHDVHMASWIGTATILAKRKDLWHGTLMFVAQPAEERVRGARAMLADGLYTRFGKPDAALGIHDHDFTPAGTAGTIPGYIGAAADSVDLTFHGVGGHGAYPQDSVDPILIAARFVVAVQAVVAREISPFDQAVITVGSFHGGLKHNIISDVVKLQLTVRSYKPEVREKLLSAIARIAKAEAAAAGAPREPEMNIIESTAALYNDPALTERVLSALATALGPENVSHPPAEMGSEDFSEFVNAGVPGVYLNVGAVEPSRFAAHKQGKVKLPSTHSPLFSPDVVPTLKTAILAETVAALELLRAR